MLNPKSFSPLRCHFSTLRTPPPRTLESPLRILLPRIMVVSHPMMFQKSTVDEEELLKLVANHFLLDHEVLQWRPTKGEDIPTPNTNEIVVLSSFFSHGFGLPT
jgi:hypothetical protein